MRTFRLRYALPLVLLLTATSSTFAAKHNYKGEVVETTTVIATPVPVEVKSNELKAGPYVGVGAGYDSFKVRQNSTLTTADGDVFTINPALSAKNWLGSVFVGYGQDFNQYYLGGEFNVNLSNASTTYIFRGARDNYESDIRARTSYGVSIIPGYKFTPATLVYAKLGLLRTDFRVKETTITTGAGASSSVRKHDTWQTGANYGVGVETLVTDKVSLRGEYNFVNYDAFSSRLGSKFSPSNSQFVLGLVYRIG